MRSRLFWFLITKEEVEFRSLPELLEFAGEDLTTVVLKIYEILISIFTMNAAQNQNNHFSIFNLINHSITTYPNSIGIFITF